MSPRIVGGGAVKVADDLPERNCPEEPFLFIFQPLTVHGAIVKDSDRDVGAFTGPYKHFYSGAQGEIGENSG
jgi:hypothetical protein